MDLQHLKRYVDLPDTHRRLLADYEGAYSLGIGLRNGDAVLVLQVEPRATQAFPASIRLGGELVPVLIDHNFSAPSPLDAKG
jgi:hypothetical protein